MTREQRKEERREQLLEVAERLFLSKGYEKTAVSDIVREAGVAQGTFYCHFKTKEDILVAVVRRTATAEVEGRIQAVVGNENLSYTERLHGLVAAVFEFVSAKRDFFEYIHQDANAALHHRLTGTTGRIVRKYLVALLEEGAAKGYFHVPYPEETADFFLGGFSAVLHVPELTADPERAERFRKAAECALERGLGLIKNE